MSMDSIDSELAALREEVWERGSHYDELRRRLRRASERRVHRPGLWIGAVFFSGIASGYAVAQVLPRWSVLFIDENGQSETVLTPLGGATEAPEGLLRSDSGELYSIERVDGRLVMRPVRSEEQAIDDE